MKTYRPLGARLLVETIRTSLSLEERAHEAGLEIVVENENKPAPTMGTVIAVGSDPLVQELVHVGETVFFNRFAGHEVVLEGKTFRSLELQEITGVESNGDTPEKT